MTDASRDITMVHGVVIDLAGGIDTDGWLVGQIFVSSNTLYKDNPEYEYLGLKTFVFNKADYFELWELYKDDPSVDTGRVPKISDLNKYDKFYVKVQRPPEEEEIIEPPV